MNTELANRKAEMIARHTAAIDSLRQTAERLRVEFDADADAIRRFNQARRRDAGQ